MLEREDDWVLVVVLEADDPESCDGGGGDIRGFAILDFSGAFLMIFRFSGRAAETCLLPVAESATLERLWPSSDPRTELRYFSDSLRLLSANPSDDTESSGCTRF